jgi:hypothetical protein
MSYKCQSYKCQVYGNKNFEFNNKYCFLRLFESYTIKCTNEWDSENMLAIKFLI